MKLSSAVFIVLILFSTICYAQNDSTLSNKEIVPYCVFETQPSFPGGTTALFRFIGKNLVFPQHVYAEGTVYISLMVNEDGSLSDLTIVKGVCNQCDKNVIETFKKMPDWIPAKQGSKPVKVRMVLPIKITHS